MVATTDRQLRILESRHKICPPAKLDEELCFYSPQENVEALRHPRVRRWLKFVSREYVAKTDRKFHTILLLLPCTKTKPYPLSPEHIRINSGLLAADFRPMTGDTLAERFSAHLLSGFPPQVLSIGALRRGNVMSQPRYAVLRRIRSQRAGVSP